MDRIPTAPSGAKPADVAAITALIGARRSVRTYAGAPVQREHMMTLLRIGVPGPDAMGGR